MGYRSTLLNSYHRERQAGQPSFSSLSLSLSLSLHPPIHLLSSTASSPGVKLLMNIGPKYQSMGIDEGGCIRRCICLYIMGDYIPRGNLS